MHNFSGWMTVLALEAFAYARNAGVVRVVFCRLKEVRVLMRRGGEGIECAGGVRIQNALTPTIQ
jgi:hypothetical protein